MTLKKLPLEGFTEKNQMVLKVNEIIDYINDAEATFQGLGLSFETKKDSCCKDDA